ncbi:hypothetical protein BAUCODRAFT_24332 [Baudoinia panamericana UAMH 10762]|uniref:PUM-HD domain-containing protein n=1 Tax=Baudoinia panamericana (strain UAMH 10762) TaxID=717646 RepID=M2NCI1_BAUPA|nr:uncharacterized protein BAUCODRAFT_24332 [Baudoinia panamericana UAMH 10762]EMC96590.1 hypothetical protein BAUCODRAFT_24332 [Baudoinia panamericana UAMH 10762]
MAYYYAGMAPQSSRDPNALSPQRNPNRLSANMSTTNAARGGLIRRFTMNEYPTVSPIGQQRRQPGTHEPVSNGASVLSDACTAAGSGSSLDGTRALLSGPGASKTVRRDRVKDRDPLDLRSRQGLAEPDTVANTMVQVDGKVGEVASSALQRGSVVLANDLVYALQHRLTNTDQSTGFGKLAPSDAAARRYEILLAQQRQIQADIAAVDAETRHEVDQSIRHEESIAAMMASSEPTSPPEYGNAFPNAFSKPNRYSTASLTSVGGIANKANRSSIQLTSPSNTMSRPYTSGNVHLPSQSVPTSRRQSDDEDDEEPWMYGFENTAHRAAAKSAFSPNRNSMPITGYARNRSRADRTSFGPVNTSGFLLDDDDDHRTVIPTSTTTSPPTARSYLQVQQTADGFPKLIRREDSNELAASALDIAFAQGVEPQQQVTDRATASRHRISLPPSALSSTFGIAPLNGILTNAESKPSAINRRSLEVKFPAEPKRPLLMAVASPPRGLANAAMQKPSLSTNDIPTLKSISNDSSFANKTAGTSPSRQSVVPTDPSSPEQQSISRVTSASTANTNRYSQEFATAAGLKVEDDVEGLTPSNHSGLQANAAPFGPIAGTHDSPMQHLGPNGMSPFAQQAYYNGYNLQMLNSGFNNMNLGSYNGPMQWPGPPYAQIGGYGQYGQYGHNGHAAASAGRIPDTRMTVQQRRLANEEAQTRYNSLTVGQLTGEIYSLCKDQHGCRYLQRKLDERADNAVEIVFVEIKDHIIELMTDPFGNYLCQKLLECTDDEQRTVLIKNSASSMTKIALNQHGTRALQKMIEYISTPQQIQIIIEALRYDVVLLIQDLNGNHVIQKCLNHLSPENAQFIFDSVGTNCIAVGTHRHGCCVLQRCIDHASGLQKGALVDQVINNAFALVQDPFGNYVVQYILDLGEPCFTEPLCQSFAHQVAYLSKQKFSSNVVEKCIRCATGNVRRAVILEIAEPRELAMLLRDSFANYVVQTAMDFADEETKNLLMENVRPILPSIRHTPYGRRIATKLQEYDARNGSSSPPASGGATPADSISSMSPPATMNGIVNGVPPYGAGLGSAGRANRNGWAGPPPQWPGFNAGANPFNNIPTFDARGFETPLTNGEVASPTPQRHNHSSSLLANGEPRFTSPGFSARQPAPFGHF